MKLELKHLAPYLPYGLTWTLQEINEFTMTGITKETLYTKEGTVLNWSFNINSESPQALFPLLRPLSDLAKEIEIDGVPIIPFDEIYIGAERYNVNTLRYSMYVEYWMMGERFVDHIYKIKNFDNCPYRIIEKLFEWHFDIYGLIEKGLAIDINTLK